MTNDDFMMQEYTKFLQWQYKDQERCDYVPFTNFKEVLEEGMSNEDIWECVKRIPFNFNLSRKLYKDRFPNAKGDKLRKLMKRELNKLRLATLKGQ